MLRKLVKSIAWAAAFSIAFLSAQRLLTPKYASGAYEGALAGEYYADEKRNQVIFIGDCEAYENFSPVRLWEGYGISSYIRGAPQQLIWQSRYVLEDTLRYETPEVVALGVNSLMYAAPQGEAYNRLNLDGMRLSKHKIRAVLESMTEGESLISYIFPILRYHDRWSELSADDFARFFPNRFAGHSGYAMRCDVLPTGIVPVGRPLADYRLGERCMGVLGDIADLCADRGIALMLFKSPGIYPYWYPQWDGQVRAFAEERGIEYINLSSLAGEIGIDMAADTYDGGLHMNVYGAEKLSDYVGAILAERYGLKDQRGDAEMRRIWDAKAEAYYSMRAAQISEFEQYGEVRTRTYAK